MPTNRRRRLQRRRQEILVLDVDTEYHLLHGMYFFDGFGEDRAAFEQAWAANGERLLAEWIAKHPGSRPFAWWLLDHGKERPILDPTVTPEQVEAMRRHSPRRAMFGFLHTKIFGGPDMQEFQEPEPVYLERLGVLTESEIAELNRRDA